MSALSFNVNSTVPGSFTITFEPEPVVDLKVFDVTKWEVENAPLVALKEQYPQVYKMALDKAKEEHANKLVEADKVEWMERTGYSKLIEQIKILQEQVTAIEQSEEGIKHLGSATARKVVKDRKTGASKGAEQLKAEKKARALKRKALKAKGDGVKCGVGGCEKKFVKENYHFLHCLLYTSPSPRDGLLSRMPSSA